MLQPDTTLQAERFAPQLLTPETALHFTPLALPSMRQHLAQRIAEGRGLAVGIGDSEPLGLVTAKLAPNGQRASIYSLYVQPWARRRGLASALLSKLEGELQVQGYQELHIAYSGSQSVAVNGLLRQCGWGPPTLTSYACRIDIRANVRMKWLFFDYQLPDTIEIFPWAEATRAELDQARALAEAPEPVAWGVSPWASPEPFEPMNSLAIRRHGQVLGWIITHRPLPDLIRYTAWYVHPEMRLTGAGIAMLARSILLQRDYYLQHGAPTQTLLRFVTNNTLMSQFVQKRLAPFGELEQEWAGRKVL